MFLSSSYVRIGRIANSYFWKGNLDNNHNYCKYNAFHKDQYMNQLRLKQLERKNNKGIDNNDDEDASVIIPTTPKPK